MASGHCVPHQQAAHMAAPTEGQNIKITLANGEPSTHVPTTDNHGSLAPPIVVSMSVLRRGKSKNWYVQFQIGGRTIIKSSRSPSRKVAEQIETQLRAQVHAGIYLGHKPTLTFGEALARFASSKQGTPNHRNVSGHIRAILRTIIG